MQQQNKNSLMIAKEVFIRHIQGNIQQDYDLSTQFLGEGGFGKVFQAKRKNNQDQHNSNELLTTSFSTVETTSRSGSDQQYTHQSRAIKRLCYNSAGDKELMKNQIEILSYVDHPSIVKIYETYEHKKELYLVIDLLKGGDLFTVINEQQKFTQNKARIVFRQIIRALCYLHSQHICHRDLKLQNILFLEKNQLNLKIVDFGLAFCWQDDMRKELKKKGLDKKIAGTPDYMSPEMLAQNYDERCDIWAAGVILYILLSGESPFNGQTDKQICQKIKNLDYDFSSSKFDSVSDNAKDLIQKILQPDDKRLSLAQILKHPWQEQTELFHNSILRESNLSLSFIESNHLKLNELNGKGQKSDATRTPSKRHSIENITAVFEDDVKSKSQCSLFIAQQQKPEQLSIKKMSHYTKLSKLQKLHATYCVSRLSQINLKTFGEEFLAIDKDNDGTISLQDLEKYLGQHEPFLQKEKIKKLFDELALSQRGYISYSQYLSCVLAYQSEFISQQNKEILEFDDASEHSKLCLTNETSIILKTFDIFNNLMLSQFFYFLDTDKDGLIGKRDFIQLLENNGIKDLNQGLIEQLSKKLDIKQDKEKKQDEKKEKKGPWFIDFCRYKDQLSRTYKGQSDGGILLDIRSFKQLMKGSQVCLK